MFNRLPTLGGTPLVILTTLLVLTSGATRVSAQSRPLVNAEDSGKFQLRLPKELLKKTVESTPELLPDETSEVVSEVVLEETVIETADLEPLHAEAHDLEAHDLEDYYLEDHYLEDHYLEDHYLEDHELQDSEPSFYAEDLAFSSEASAISISADSLLPVGYSSIAENTAELLIAGEPGTPIRSRALNLGALRALKKPLTDRVLDTVFSAPFRQRPENPTFWSRDFLTGDWGGQRDRLYDQGIDLYALQIVDAYVQPTGGQSQSSAVNSLTLVGTDLHTDRLGWWPNGQIHVTAALIETESLARDSIGALNSTYFNDAPTNGARLFEVWYGQKFNNNRGEVRLGTLYPFVRIASNQPSSMFTNTAFDYPHFLGTTPDLGMSLPYAAAPFGVQFNYSISPEVFFIGQLSDGFQDPSGGIENYRNISVGLNAEEGMEGILELSYKPNQRTGLAGNYKAGVQFHTGRFNVNNTVNSATTQWGNGAIYALADQRLYAESDSRTQGLTGFLKTVYTPYEDINTVDFHAAGGLTYEGLIPRRDRDVFGLAIAYSQISGGLRDADRLANTSVRGGETVAEMIYSADLAPWWTLIGSVQYIIDPGGFSDREDALVLGLSSRFAF